MVLHNGGTFSIPIDALPFVCMLVYVYVCVYTHTHSLTLPDITGFNTKFNKNKTSQTSSLKLYYTWP